MVTHDRRIARVLAAVVSCLVVLGYLPWTAGQEPPSGLEASLDQVVQRFLIVHDIPGAAVGVVRDGELIYAKGHGVRSVERQEPVLVNTLFQIGSVTKVLTTTLLLQLRDEGRIALDDPVGMYLPPQVEMPSWKVGEERLIPTLRHLVTHRSGLPRDPPNRRDRPHSPSNRFRVVNPGFNFVMGSVYNDYVVSIPPTERIDYLVLAKPSWRRFARA